MAALKPISGLETFAVPDTRGYDVIYGLARGAGPEIYISVSNEFTPGLCANIYSFDPFTQEFRRIIDFAHETSYSPVRGQLPHSKVHLSLQASREGQVFAATHFTAPALGQSDFEPIQCFRGLFKGSFVAEYQVKSNRVINHGCLLPGEGCRITALDDTREMLYLVSYPRNHLCRFHYRTGKLDDLGRLSQENSFGLEVDDSGNLFTTDDCGRFLKFSDGDDGLAELDCYVPVKPGRRRQGNYARRMIKGVDGYFYGAGNKGVRLFQFCPRKEQVRDLGVVFGAEAKTNYRYPSLPPLKALAQTDSRTLLLVFGGDGIYADENHVPSLVRYDLVSGETIDLGRFVDVDGTPGWIPQCALYCAAEHSLYVGLQQAVGELRLWRVRLDQVNESARAVSISSEHEKKVNAVPFGESVRGAGTLPYLHTGNVSLLQLGWFGEGRVVPPGETALCDLQFVGDVLYGITRGKRSHFIRYAPYAYNRFVENYDVHPCDLGTILNAPVSGGRILHQVEKDHLLLLLGSGSAIQAFFYDRSLEARSYRPHFHSVPHWDPFMFPRTPWVPSSCWKQTDFSIANIVFDSKSEQAWSVNGDGELVCINFVTATLASTGIYAVPNSCVQVGPSRLFLFSPRGEASIVDVSGKAKVRSSVPSTRITEITCGIHSETHALVGLGTPDGSVLFFDSTNGKLRGEANLGLKVRALCASGATAYGFCGRDNDIGEPFVLDLVSLEVQRLGILQVRSNPRFWINHRCDCVAIGREGEVYFGEADRISHLFVYRPPTSAAHN